MTELAINIISNGSQVVPIKEYLKDTLDSLMEVDFVDTDNNQRTRENMLDFCYAVAIAVEELSTSIDGYDIYEDGEIFAHFSAIKRTMMRNKKQDLN